MEKITTRREGSETLSGTLYNYTIRFAIKGDLLAFQRVVNLCRRRGYGYALGQLHLSPLDEQGGRKVLMNVICEPPVFQQCYLRLNRLLDVYDLSWNSKQIVTADNTHGEEQNPGLDVGPSESRSKGNSEINQTSH